MAKLTVTVTVAVFLFALALAQARIPLYQKENDVITEESDPKTRATWPTSILLPSQKIESETETGAKPETSESEKSESETNDFLPLPMINFHPINRHFRHHPSLTFRHRRPHSLGKPWGQSRIHRHEMTYSNDMLVSKGDVKEEVREIPTKWLKFPQGDAHVHRFHFWRHDDVAKEDRFRRPYQHHLHRRHVADGDEQQTGFMNKIRKFLNH